MAAPKLIINGVDFTEYVSELNPTLNDLDAEGAGRDITDGTMHRTLIAKKYKLEVSFMRLGGAVMRALHQSTEGATFTVTFLDPATNADVTRTFYKASIPFGAQGYSRTKNEVYYEGTTLSLTEV